jgi:hypothetical protein
VHSFGAGLRCSGRVYVSWHTHMSFIQQEVLKAEFPKGVDVVYESVGGDMFDTVSLDAVMRRMCLYAATSCELRRCDASHVLY